MATTLKKLKELSLKTIEAVIKSPEAWKKYLSTTPRTFRYSFEDQILIYAQAPKATAVATYDVWNKLMYRAVKRGSSGIGLIHTKKSYEKIDYVFDVSQTVERSDSRPLYIWKVTADNEATIKSYLQNTISTDEVTDNIPDLLQELIKESTNEVIDDLCDALKEDVTESEYKAARESVLNAHFTQPVIIESIYDALEQMGFRNGNVLEPAMGIGNFFGVMPESMRNSKLYGVELDEISGRIAKQLYPDADIHITGYENSGFPDDFFDVAIGNVPFGNYQVFDRRYEKQHFMIHDYFFAKTLDQLRSGGIIAFITSKGTMDKKSDTVRAYLSQRAELLGAIRLPNNAFKNNAGTEVTSDILFFQKREGISYDTPEWLNLGVNEDGIELNQYFITHPEMILGHMEEISGPYGKETACIPYKDANLKEQLSHAISLIHGQIYVEERPEVMFEEDQKDIPAVPSVKNYSYTIVKDQLYFRENSRMRPVSIPKATEERVRGMIAIRESVRRLIALQMDENGTEEEIKAEQKQLNAIYDEFYNKYGVIGSNGNKRAFSIDASYCLLCSLEVLDENGNLERNRRRTDSDVNTEQK